MKTMDETECFAYKKGKCKILKVTNCEGCSFLKTNEELQEERQKALQRIQSLDVNKREYIMEVYFGGQTHLLDEEVERL